MCRVVRMEREVSGYFRPGVELFVSLIWGAFLGS
jgi:hypothetical protein